MLSQIQQELRLLVNKKWVVLGLLFIIAFATFSNSLGNSFLIDDHAFFTDRDVTDIHSWYKHFNLQRTETTQGPYRPLSRLIPMVMFHFFDYNVFAYHLANLVLWVLACFGVYLFVSYFFVNQLLAFLCAVMYCVHPINGLLVNYITASVFSVQVIFMLLALWCLGKKRTTFVDAILVMLSFTIALFCHETVLILPLYAILLLWNAGMPRREIVFRLWPLAVTCLGFLIFHIFVANLKGSVLSKLALLWQKPDVYFLGFSKVIVWYSSKLFLPLGIVLTWTTPLLENTMLFGTLAFILLIGIALLLLKYFRKDRPALIGLLWFMAGFIPVSCACVFQILIGFEMEPHWMVFSSIGFFLWLSAVFLSEEVRRFRFILIVWVTLVVGWVFVSRQYNEIWSNEKRYCEFWLKEAPDFKLAKFYLGMAYMREVDYDKARYYFWNSMQPISGWMIFNNLAAIDIAVGNYDRADLYLEQVLNFHPTGLVWANRALLAIRMNKKELAKEYFEKAILIDPYFGESAFQLAQILADEGKTDEAVSILRKNLIINTYNNNSLYLLTKLYVQGSDITRAKFYAKQLFEYCNDAVILTDLGSLMATVGDLSMAQQSYEKAISVDLDYPQVYKEMGKLFANQGQKQRALRVWSLGMQKFPEDIHFKELIDKLKKIPH